MATPDDYRAKIQQYDRGNLQRLLRDVEEGRTIGWEPGMAFQYLVLRAFQLEGAQVDWPFSVPPEGEPYEQIDGIVYAAGFACLVETKDWASDVNIEPIAKLRNQLLRRPSSTIGLVFSRAGFTRAAIVLARFLAPQTVLLWEGNEIAYGLEKQCLCWGLQEKYRHCVKYGLPDYNIFAST